MIHQLKTEDSYLKNLISGHKKSGVRLNDRDCQKGNTLLFKGYFGSLVNPKEYLFEITHIHSGLCMEKDYVCYLWSIYHNKKMHRTGWGGVDLAASQPPVILTLYEKGSCISCHSMKKLEIEYFYGATDTAAFVKKHVELISKCII